MTLSRCERVTGWLSGAAAIAASVVPLAPPVGLWPVERVFGVTVGLALIAFVTLSARRPTNGGA